MEEHSVIKLHITKQPASQMPTADTTRLGLSEVRAEHSFMKDLVHQAACFTDSCRGHNEVRIK